MSTRRTQPYRATGARQQTAALRSMQRGRGPMPYLSEARRRASKRKRRRKGRARESSPLRKILRSRRRLS